MSSTASMSLSCMLLFSFVLQMAVCLDQDQPSRAHRLQKRVIEGLEDNCYELCSKKHPTEIGAFAFALGMMMGRQQGPFWDCFAKCLCHDPVPGKRTGGGGLRCPRS